MPIQHTVGHYYGITIVESHQHGKYSLRQVRMRRGRSRMSSEQTNWPMFSPCTIQQAAEKVVAAIGGKP
jgi:hypothetical protein